MTMSVQQEENLFETALDKTLRRLTISSKDTKEWNPHIYL